VMTKSTLLHAYIDQRQVQTSCLKPSGPQQAAMSFALQSHTGVRARNLPAGSSSRTAQPKSHQVAGYSAAPRKPAAGQPDLPQCMRPRHTSERSSAHAA